MDGIRKKNSIQELSSCSRETKTSPLSHMWVTLFILNFVDLTSSSYRNQETRKGVVVVVGCYLKEGKLEYS